MPEYEYHALTGDGRRRHGRIGAESAADARRRLRDEGLNVLSIEAGVPVAQAAPERVGRVRKRDVATALRQLATLLRGGMALVPALEALCEQLQGEPLGGALTEMKEKVRTGSGFADVMALYPAVFPEVYVSLVHAGEAVGALDSVLLRIAEMTEKSLEVSGRVRAALIYPAILSLTGAAVVVFLLTFVVPGITRLFVELEQQLPLPTIVLIHVSDFVRAYFWAIIAVLIFGTLGLRAAAGYDTVKCRLDAVKLRVPVVGTLLLKASLARFSRTLAVMLGSGVPVLQALENAGRVTANASLAAKIAIVGRQVEEGAGLAGPLARSGIFPPIVVHMVASGEASGNVEEGLKSVAEIYQTEVENSIATITSLVEPLMILLMGAIIGFMVLAVLLPIFEINHMVGG